MMKFVQATVVAGLLGCALLVVLGLLAHLYRALDIVNNGLPFLAAGAAALLVLAFVTGPRRLIGAAAAVLTITVSVFLFNLTGTAPQAPRDADRLLRVVTFNLWGHRDHPLQQVAEFLNRADADAVVLTEVRRRHAAFIEELAGQYPHRVGDSGLFILSKHPILADGRNDRGGQPYWMSRILRWARLDVKGEAVTLAGVHLARPFYPAIQQADVAAITRFVQQQSGPVIVAGDFNMAPWTVTSRAFTKDTALGRFNTFDPTWPLRWRSLPLVPLLPIDNVFASAQFANIATTAGPRLYSDHRPVIADLALID